MIWLAAAGHELVPALLVEHIILRIRKLCGRWTTDTFANHARHEQFAAW
jgi:hypothetical protein